MKGFPETRAASQLKALPTYRHTPGR